MATVSKIPSRFATDRRSDGSPLALLPHDCRRVFASEHLNNNTPVQTEAKKEVDKPPVEGEESAPEPEPTL
jgi:hypothetical protein